MLDGTKTQPDTTLTAEKTGTPSQSPTYTQADLDKAVKDKTSAFLADVKRSQTEAANARKASEAAEARTNQAIAELDRRELEAAQDDPQRLSALQERQARRKVESELAEAKSKLAKEEEWRQQTESERAETKRTQIVQETATRFNVDPIRLARLAKATDGSPEAIEDLAKDLPTGTPKSPLKPDSGGAIGGSVSYEQLRDRFIKDPQSLSPEEKATHLAMYEARKRT